MSIKPVGELGGEFNKLYESYFNELSKLGENETDSTNKDLLNSLKPIILNYTYLKSLSDLYLEMDDNIPGVICCSLEKLFPLCIEKHSLHPETNSNSELHKALIKISADMAAEICLILNIVTFESFKFCKKFIEIGGLEISFKYLSSETLLDAYVDAASRDTRSDEFKCIDKTMRRVIGSLVCLARTYTTFKSQWKDQNSVKKFLRYLERTKNIIDNKLYACMAVAYVTDDEDIEQLPQLKEVLPDLIRMVSRAATLIKDDLGLKREKVQLNESSNETKEVCCVNHMDTQWSLINILKALYHLSVSDKLKYDIYFRHSLGKHLSIIIYNGNEVEQEYCLMVLWQLCFDKQIATDVANDAVLFSYINELDKKSSGSLHKNTSGILWALKKRDEVKTPTPTKPEQPPLAQMNQVAPATPSPPTPLIEQAPQPALKSQASVQDLKFGTMARKVNQKHIMISYNRDSRDLCLRIKSELEKEDYRVWIDVEDISGSSLESMANAIENSVCVLMCMTEKYKQSTNCRAEAEYAFQLGRPIIPLIMQKDYKPDGWLGIILGSKIFIHFMKYDFEECIRRLKAEIQAVYKNNEITAGLLEMFKPIPEPKINIEDHKILEVALPSKPTQQHNESVQSKQHQQQQQVYVPTTHHQRPILDVKEINWTESQVHKWFMEKRIEASIVKNISPCDGRVLYELFLIKHETPEFFYKSLGYVNNSFNKGPTLRDIALFSYELKKIFVE